ncbi:hypothetical protein CDL12_18517 [Handroanthus impetiginosus]|uniref:Uncharacterized protein n=1 Tax=Handroanthus impetiginosus TaxID=429701 RepID=A0A2G9GUG4_9LAMI|nr:hypothetical protein CDL12_18517 [Handroanthus impetiginosus]
MIKNPFCRPRFRPPAAAAKSRRVSPMSLLDRLREAVFRLIMLSALSRGSNDIRRRSQPPPSEHYYYPGDAHHSEAVADCIEFIKKSATETDESRDSAAARGCSNYAEAAPPVVHLPVMLSE